MTPHLTLVETASGKTHRVDGPEALVGRDPACAILVEGDLARTVSGRHARFFLEDTKWFVEDAGSRNGTYIGAEKLVPGARHQLAPGEIIGLGLTGTQLGVQEAIGRALAATMLEAAPVPPPVAGGTIPMRRSEASRAGINDIGLDDVFVVLRDTATGVRVTGHHDRVTLGRSLECIIRIEGESATSVSRIHAEISAVNGRVSIRDGGSRHGTIVNGKRIDSAVPLATGDSIALGPGGPTFIVEEAKIATGESPAPSAAGSPSAPAERPASAPARREPPQDGDFFQAENPTPALGQPAFKSPPAQKPPRKIPAASRGSEPVGSSRVGARNKSRARVMTWAAIGIIAVLAVTLGIAFL